MYGVKQNYVLFNKCKHGIVLNVDKCGTITLYCINLTLALRGNYRCDSSV